MANETENTISTIPHEVNPAGLNISKAQDALMSRVLGSINAFTQQGEQAKLQASQAQATQADSQPVPPVVQQRAQNPQQAPVAEQPGAVPYDRFSQAIADKNAAIAEAKAVKERLAQLERSTAAEKTAKQRLAEDPVANGSDGDDAVDDKTIRVARVMAEEMVKQALGANPGELQQLLAERRVASELGSVSAQQAQVIAQVCQQTGLSPAEASMIAAHRNPSLFPSQDARGPNPMVHSQTSPTSAAQVPQNQKSRYDQLKGLAANIPGMSAYDKSQIGGEMLVEKLAGYFAAPPR